MASTALQQVQHLVDQLSPLDQARLLASLSTRVAQIVAASQAMATDRALATDPWQELFRIGDALEADDSPEIETMTAAVTQMRR